MSADRRAELESRLAEVTQRLDRACAESGRSPGSVMLLPVTKFFPASDIEILRDLGCTDFGEAREQDASAKVHEIGVDGIRWHMIGRLQRNKAKSVAHWAHTIHSVDSERLVNALEKAVVVAKDAGDRETDIDVLLQISLDGDTHRGGAERDDLEALADRVAGAEGLRLAGLMAVPPIDADADRCFEDLRTLHTRLLASHPGADRLSAGMTGDLEEAVRHGSTCVRVGTAILGPRPITSP